MSYITRAKLHGANALLGAYINTGTRFDRVLEGLRVVAIEHGRCVCELPVAEHLLNTYGSLHGGATATIVDVVGTIALLTEDPTRPGVSVDINVSYVAPAKAGDTVVCEGRVLKSGRRLGFTEVVLTSKATGRLVATGRHTKAL